MVEFYFTSDKEVSCFCEHVFRSLKRIELYWKQDDEWGNCVQLISHETDVTDSEQRIIASSMVDVFMTYRLGSYVKHIITDVYYFENETEINRIADVSEWILLSDDANSKVLRQSMNVKETLLNLFLSMIKTEKKVHFDSIVHFRFTDVRELFIEHVGRAIDEYKREEEHQAYVNMLREYVTTLESKVDVIHVVQGEPFLFYKQHGKKYARLELRSIMHEAPLYLIGLDAEEFNIAPLIALCPKHIYVYGNDPSDPKTLTVMNVFEERVTFHSLHVFPFTMEKGF